MCTEAYGAKACDGSGSGLITFRHDGSVGVGAKYLLDEEAMMVGKDNMRHSHATHDLYNAIDSGNFPTWNLNVQVSPGECCGLLRKR